MTAAPGRPSRLLDHIRNCNNRDLSRFRPFEAAGVRVGWIRDDFLPRLTEAGDVFGVTLAAVRLASRFATAEARSAAMADVVRGLVQHKALAKFRAETYAVVTDWGQEPVFLLDRSAVAAFGVRAFGIHINGYVRDKGRVKVWVGTRAMDKAVAPGKLDNMVAGGQPHGLSLTDNLIKEAAEEADISRDMALRAVPVSAITYCMEGERGLKPDTMFVYDLEVPANFTPRNTDGEITSFALMELDELTERLRTTYDFKFNVNLVMIDFLIRMGHITPENEPDYLALAAGLHAPL